MMWMENGNYTLFEVANMHNIFMSETFASLHVASY